ncbi:MAG: PKD domain-containing protein [Bacteroidales bacterium]|nr:PKD domain-containing protein [Bacteroidales bacterium]
MKKEFQNIEDLFKSKFEDYHVEPSEKVWNTINTKLKVRRFLNSSFSKTLFFSMTVAIITLAVTHLKDNNENKNNLTKPIASVYRVEKKIKIENIEVEKQDIKNNSQKYFNEQNKIKIDKIEKNNELIRERESAPLIISKRAKLIEDAEAKLSEQIKLTAPASPAPAPVFSLDEKEGCVPFTVKINNLSKHAIAYEWDFGDGNKSNDFMPQHTYRHPGVYKITLKAKGTGGVAISFIDSIVVHKQAHAEILWPYESEILTGQKIQIPNYSKNVSKVEWSFGDKSVSNEKNGQHIFKQKGDYTICMKIWSEDGCVDSAVLNNVKVIDINEKIVFPNAFTPNLDGPASGYYNPMDVYNDVFFPKYIGTIEEYELRIFSKFGVEVFKSNDISYGWNGYYQNRLMPEGVYVYIVHGKFEGNQKFSFKGNVTLLHKK